MSPHQFKLEITLRSIASRYFYISIMLYYMMVGGLQHCTSSLMSHLSQLELMRLCLPRSEPLPVIYTEAVCPPLGMCCAHNAVWEPRFTLITAVLAMNMILFQPVTNHGNCFLPAVCQLYPPYMKFNHYTSLRIVGTDRVERQMSCMEIVLKWHSYTWLSLHPAI